MMIIYNKLIWFLRSVVSYLTGSVMLCLAFSGCIGESLSDCLGVRVMVGEEATDPDMSVGAIDDIRLYVFDSEENPVHTIRGVALEELVLLSGLTVHGEFKVVAVANDAGQQNIDLETAEFELKQNGSFDGLTTYDFPSDLFTGQVVFRNDGTDEKTKDVYITRITGQVIVKIRGMRFFAGSDADDDDFKVLLRTGRGSVPLSPEQMPPLAGNAYHFLFPGNFSGSDYYETEAGNFFASAAGDPVRVLVYHGQEKLNEVSVDDTGAPLLVRAGKRLEVRIDCRGGDLNVSLMEALWWNEETIWKEY